MKLLREVWLRHKYNIKIITFGCTKEELNSLNILNDFTCHFDILSRKELAWLFNEIDIFVDFSSYQAMGLTALEAMACGAAVIVPSAGGSKEFVAHEINGLIVDTSSEEDCLDSLNRLILDDKLRIKLGRQALKDVCQYSPEKAAYNTLLALFPINEENSV
jgi:glycosyltransferase involved in cell wall biosynthesis